MANYKETQINATKYQRAKFVMINNEKGYYPRISFTEEQIVILDDGSFIKNECGLISEELNETSSTEQFNIVDSNGNIVGQATYNDVYNMLSSLYLHIASKRDGSI